MPELERDWPPVLKCTNPEHAALPWCPAPLRCYEANHDLADVALEPPAPQVELVFEVHVSDESVTLPLTPKVAALLESWLHANHFARDDAGDWRAEGVPAGMPLELALGRCATFPE